MLSFDAVESPLSFGVVKQILSVTGLARETTDLQLARSLRIISPLDERLAASVRAGSTSLTDAATSTEQIRFFQHRRADRSFIRLAQHISELHGPLEIRVGGASAVDPASREFLRLAAAVAGWRVAYTEQRDGSPEYLPDGCETRVLLALQKPSEDNNAHVLWASAFDYVNAGDAWTAVRLGRVLASVEQSSRVWNLLALSFAMLNEPEAAEYYYDAWFAGGDTLDQVRALYGKAMLYARHHHAGIRDLERSGALLDEAFGLIQSMPADVQAGESLIFEEVFNRNGFALVEFRRGHVAEAVALLDSGISRLTQTSEKVAIHRSVLIHNVAQCYKQLGQLDAAIRTYEQLLSVDPHMPEYWLEAAKCYAADGRFTEAVDRCERAIKLDDALSTSWSLKGCYLGDAGMAEAAAAAYRQAAALAPDQQSHGIDAAYYSLVAGDLASAISALRSVRPALLNESGMERYISLLAQIDLGRGHRNDAVGRLREALDAMPNSSVLRKNLETALQA
jgi:tetratricopeptide (TPR) repeat protein